MFLQEKLSIRNCHFWATAVLGFWGGEGTTVDYCKVGTPRRESGKKLRNAPLRESHFLNTNFLNGRGVAVCILPRIASRMNLFPLSMELFLSVKLIPVTC